ncbi:MAG TPA: methyl-accepting chemotaxis protein [Ilumatobacter sp.]
MNDDSGRSDGLADLINLLATPIAGGLRTVEQVRKGVDELLRAIENINRTMENVNETATRVNRLLADLEEPVRAMVPQLTRTVKAADEMTKLLEAPVRSVAPNLERIADTLSSPGFSSLPSQLGDFMATIGEMSRRLGPLTAFAENAGGLFGGFRLPGSGRPAPAATPPSAPTPAGPGAAKAPAKKAPAKKAPAKKKSTGA